jgi:ATP-dependent DNA helicase RecQ
VGDSLSLTVELKRRLGHQAFRPGQEGLVRAVMEGRDALGILPTGGGKSVCFQLPAFLLSGMVLVVSPLISLMEDQVGRARKAGLRADFLSSATPPSQRAAVVARALAGDTDLLLVAPERFLVTDFKTLLPRLPVSLLAVDEAHCVSQWGHDFRPAYLRIGEVREVLPVPILALTATATPRVRREVTTSLRLQDPARVVGSFDRPNLSWEVRRAGDHGEKVRVAHSLLRARTGATIIYASTRRTVESVRRFLASRGLPALAYHAGLSPAGRTQVQKRFLEDGGPVVVATNAFGMGIDRPDVRMVVHYQLPGSLEAYYQEAGRGGRDGEDARCVALWGPKDRRIHDAFASHSYPGEPLLRAILGWLVNNFPTETPVEIDTRMMGRTPKSFGGEEDVRVALRVLAQAGALLLDGDVLTVLDPDPDFSPVRVLRKVSESQIVAVERYARGPGCRRRAILRYFGETGSAPRCGRCDNCIRPFRRRVGEGIRQALVFSRP